MPTIINLAQIELLKKYGGQALIEESFAIFLKESTKLLNQSKDLLSKQKYKELAANAHSLKGSSRTLGIDNLGNAAEKLEQICKQNKINQVNSAFNTVLNCFEEFMDNYQAILGI